MAHFNLQRVAVTLRDQFPGLEPVTPLRVLAQGFGSMVVETPSGFVFRLALNAVVAARQQRERALLRRIHPHIHRFILPDPQYQVTPSAAIPFGGVGYRRLEGVPLQPADLTAGDRNNLTVQLADFIGQLQKIPLARLTGLDLPQFPPPPSELERMGRKIMPFLRDALSGNEYDALAGWWEEAVSKWESPVQQPVLAHGDLWYENILLDVERQTILGILDFESAAIGDPLTDLVPQFYLGDVFLQAVARALPASHYISDLNAHLRRLLGLRELMGLAYGLQVGEVDEDTVPKIRSTILELR
ncbi:MAG: phosphotransferase family protein [Chloroflexota bacterium]